MGDFFSMLGNQIVSTEVTLVNSVFRLLLSMVLGVLVGAERKRRGRLPVCARLPSSLWVRALQCCFRFMCRRCIWGLRTGIPAVSLRRSLQALVSLVAVR